MTYICIRKPKKPAKYKVHFFTGKLAVFYWASLRWGVTYGCYQQQFFGENF